MLLEAAAKFLGLGDVDLASGFVGVDFERDAGSAEGFEAFLGPMEVAAVEGRRRGGSRRGGFLRSDGSRGRLGVEEGVEPIVGGGSGGEGFGKGLLGWCVGLDGGGDGELLVFDRVETGEFGRVSDSGFPVDGLGRSGPRGRCAVGK